MKNFEDLLRGHNGTHKRIKIDFELKKSNDPFYENPCEILIPIPILHIRFSAVESGE